MRATLSVSPAHLLHFSSFILTSKYFFFIRFPVVAVDSAISTDLVLAIRALVQSFILLVGVELEILSQAMALSLRV